ncbi:MAG TPA: phosphotransferase [Propionibacteriaceae bacterium]|nr:phosphotransferase [Propionibacteriaceae bacterium]
MVPDQIASWTSGAFLDEVQAWVAAQLASRSIRLTGEWEQPHIRFWSSTIRFETTGGRVWFKVNGNGTAYEVSLLALLSELCPGLAPEVLAHDSTRAWSLSRGAGPVLRSIVGPEEMWGYWKALLPRYAQAQLDLAAHRSRFVATGTPDRCPKQLTFQYRRLLSDLAAKPIKEGGLTREEVVASERLLPRYDGWCAELMASTIPDTLQHDDLHSNNVCWPGALDDLSAVRIIDWGDACIGHPFGTMLATLNSIAFHAGLLNDERGGISDPRMRRVRDAYLEPFTGLGSRQELLRWMALARSIGCLTRALSWERAVQHAPVSVAAEYEFPVRGWILELLQPWAQVD